MSNMSYCRFQNTYRDLEDCLQALEDLLYQNEDGSPLSDSETRHARNLIKTAQEIIELVRGMVPDLEDDAPMTEAEIKKVIDDANAATREANDRREAEEYE